MPGGSPEAPAALQTSHRPRPAGTAINARDRPRSSTSVTKAAPRQTTRCARQCPEPEGALRISRPAEGVGRSQQAPRRTGADGTCVRSASPSPSRPAAPARRAPSPRPGQPQPRRMPQMERYRGACAPGPRLRTAGVGQGPRGVPGPRATGRAADGAGRSDPRPATALGSRGRSQPGRARPHDRSAARAAARPASPTPGAGPCQPTRQGNCRGAAGHRWAGSAEEARCLEPRAPDPKTPLRQGPGRKRDGRQVGRRAQGKRGVPPRAPARASPARACPLRRACRPESLRRQLPLQARLAQASPAPSSTRPKPWWQVVTLVTPAAGPAPPGEGPGPPRSATLFARAASLLVTRTWLSW